jgi:hypothetical protein
MLTQKFLYSPKGKLRKITKTPWSPQRNFFCVSVIFGHSVYTIWHCNFTYNMTYGLLKYTIKTLTAGLDVST